MFDAVREVIKYRNQFLDLLVGVPNYERYVEHMREHHPDEPIQSRDQFSAKRRMPDIMRRAVKYPAAARL